MDFFLPGFSFIYTGQLFLVRERDQAQKHCEMNRFPDIPLAVIINLVMQIGHGFFTF